VVGSLDVAREPQLQAGAAGADDDGRIAGQARVDPLGVKLAGLAARPVDAPRDDSPVTMLELFFDLVFVFVVTQVTALINPASGWAGYGRAALVLSLTWYIYNGFAWLTNNVAPTTLSTRLPMFAAMACFLAMAVVVPQAFGDGAWVFALAYLMAVAIHAVQFARSSLGTSAEAIRSILPVNLAVAMLVVVAAAAGPTWGWVAWCLAVVVIFAAATLGRGSKFTLRAHHFAERHQLLVIIALGETIIQVGQGSANHLTDPPVVAAFIAGLSLIMALWWVYFGTGDDTRGAEAFSRTPDEGRAILGSRAYSAAHLLHISGLVLCASGLNGALHHPMDPLGAALAVTTSAGVGLFLIGQAMFRAALGLGSSRPHLVAMAMALVAALVGVLGPAVALLAVLVLVLLGLSWLLGREGPRWKPPADPPR
jgi:low temperature requirement protein LtrA